MSKPKPNEPFLEPQPGDVLVMPDGRRRHVIVVGFYVEYVYRNALGFDQTVRPRKHAWVAACRKAIREGGRYEPNPRRDRP